MRKPVTSFEKIGLEIFDIIEAGGHIFEVVLIEDDEVGFCINCLPGVTSNYETMTFEQVVDLFNQSLAEELKERIITMEEPKQPNIPVIDIEKRNHFDKIINGDVRDVAIWIPPGVDVVLPRIDQAVVIMYEGEVAGFMCTHVRIETVVNLPMHLFKQIAITNPEAGLMDRAAVVVFEPFPALQKVLDDASATGEEAEPEDPPVSDAYTNDLDWSEN